MLAFAAAVTGVAGAWDCLAGFGAGPVWRRALAVLTPVRRAGEEGRAPSIGERRRLAALLAGCLLAAGWLLSGPAAGAVLAAAGPAATAAAIRLRRSRHGTELRRGAAPAARAMAGALAAGRSVRAALVEAADDVDGPAGRELRAAASALELGEPTDAVLERLRQRARGGPWDTLVAALTLQRDAGGDLAGLLRELAGSLEHAARAERDARAATAQARITARIVAALPLVAAVLAELAAPGFLAALATNPVSLALVAAAAMLQGVAVILVRRIAG